ncbi:MAG: YigZ family protein [Myxococcales bacterium]|jgi:uncharacterized YigZ family protein|nr:YigZ family protein [Myxococcales bacterium]
MPVLIAVSPAEAEIEVRRSRFLAKAHPVDTEADAQAWLKAHADRSATHNCWAFRIGDLHRCFDDGEPGGTAGRPILAAIEHANMQQVAVLVIRHFGGIKLGTGGLARAYGAAAAECLQRVECIERVPMTSVTLQIPFHATSAVYQLLPVHQATPTDETYLDDGLTMTVALPQQQRDVFCQQLTDTTRGAVTIVKAPLK